MLKKLAASGLVAVLALAFVACSSDSSDDASSETTVASTETTASSETTASTETTGTVPADRAEYCALVEQGTVAFQGVASPNDMVAVATEMVDSGLAYQTLADAPDEIADDVAVAYQSVVDASNGDPHAMQSPEVRAAGTSINAFCGTTP